MATRVTSIETGRAGDEALVTGFARLAELHSALADEYAAMAQCESTPAGPEPHGPELVRIREACTRMAWRYSWATKNWRRLGGFRDADAALKIRVDVLARYAARPDSLPERSVDSRPRTIARSAHPKGGLT